jgi:hypothetical protein
MHLPLCNSDGFAGRMTATQRHPGTSWRKRTLQLSVLAALLVGLPGCQSIAVTNTQAAEIRFVDASPDITLPGLDFYLNKTAAIYNVGYTTHSSYIPVTPGNYTVAADADGTTQTLVSTSATLANGHTYSYIVGNELANLSGTLLQDQTSPAPSGEASFRFIDQASKVGAVDIYAIPAGATLITTIPILTNVTFGANTGYLNIPANSYTLAVLPAGTQPIANTITLYTGLATNYTSGVVNTFFLTDQQITTVPGLQIFSVPDSPAN